MYTENGKREDPIEKKMNEFYYNAPPSPTLKSSKLSKGNLFKIKSKRFKSTEFNRNNESKQNRNILF